MIRDASTGSAMPGRGLARPGGIWEIVAILAATTLSAADVDTSPPDGLRDATPQVHAFVGGKIVVAPGHMIEKGVLVVRDGTIVAVGANVAIPADARVWDVSRNTI